MAEEFVSSLCKIQILMASAKGKEVCGSQDKNSVVEEGDEEARDVFIIDQEEFPNFLGLDKEGTISLFRLFKWVFHELNITNVRVRGAMRKVGESS